MLEQNNTLKFGLNRPSAFFRCLFAGVLICALSACQQARSAEPVSAHSQNQTAHKVLKTRPAGKLLEACRTGGYVIRGRELLLAPSTQKDRQRLYVFHNDSKYPVTLGLAPAGTMASAGWDTQLPPQHWTALVLARTDFRIQCDFLKKGKTLSAPCSDLIRVCQIAEPDFMIGTEGTYWLAEDQSSGDALRKATAERGVSW